MKSKYKVIAPVILILLAVVPYLRLLHGQFLYDDYQVIFTNRSLWQVKTFADCFRFVLKPSKPVTNFFLALGHHFGGGVMGHRVLSLVFHTLVVLLIYANLQALIPRFEKKIPRELPFWIAALFALAPVHSEAIAIALFNMEILGTLFSLLALWFFCHRAKQPWLFWPVIFLCLGLAQLSKETFAVFAPLTLVLVAWFLEKRKKLCFVIGGMELFWAAFLIYKLREDGRSEYPYGDVIGFRALPWLSQIRLSARALVEGVVKTLSGWNLTVIRLSDRGGIGYHWGIGLCAFVLVLGVLGFAYLYSQKGWWRFWGSWLFVGVGLYLVIPNINIGSEHYWYFPAIAFFSLIVFAVWQGYEKVLSHPRQMMGLTMVTWLLCFAMVLGLRVSQMPSRLSLYAVEALHHPESPVGWNNVAVAMMESDLPDRFQAAKPFIERAKAIAPNYPNIQITEFLYYLNVGDRARAEESLHHLDKLFEHEPEKLSRYYEYFGLSHAKSAGG